MAASLGSKVAGYFDLRRRPPEARAGEAVAADGELAAPAIEVKSAWSENLWLGAAYLGQVLGVLGKQVYDDIMRGAGLRLHLPTLVLAAIVSAATFPMVYRSLEAQASRPMRLFLAFQNGFFWQSVLGQVTPSALGGICSE